MAVSAFTLPFAEVDDPRIERSKQHALVDILFLCVAATIAGCDGPTEIVDFTTQKITWFRKFIRLENGVPSHDTVGRVLSLIKPDQFQKAFLQWISSLADERDDEGRPKFVPIDGKTLRGSRGAKHRTNPLHPVSAWASEQGLTLGQVAVDSKSNEITAIPKLLEMLELTGAIVTIDAMGCQKEIAKKIVSGGDYTLAVKDNQRALRAALESFFDERHEEDDFSEYGCRRHHGVGRSRGRLEERYYTIAPVPESMKSFCGPWKNLTSIGQVLTVTEQAGRQTSDVRYYISSRPPKVNEFASSVRKHWSIESMHWILDVVFREDQSRIRGWRRGARISAS